MVAETERELRSCTAAQHAGETAQLKKQRAAHGGLDLESRTASACCTIAPIAIWDTFLSLIEILRSSCARMAPRPRAHRKCGPHRGGPCVVITSSWLGLARLSGTSMPQPASLAAVFERSARSERRISGAAFLSPPWRKRPCTISAGLRRELLRQQEKAGWWCRPGGNRQFENGSVHAWPPAPAGATDRNTSLDEGDVVRILRRTVAAGPVPYAKAISAQLRTKPPGLRAINRFPGSCETAGFSRPLACTQGSDVIW